MSDIAIKFQNISKQYRLGEIGTGTLSHWTVGWLKYAEKKTPIKTIILGMDLRKPRLSDYFKTKTKNGITSYLINNAMLYVVRHKFTVKQLFAHNIGLVEESGIANVGIIMNGIKTRKRGYGYGYGYGEKETKKSKKKSQKTEA